MKDVDGRMETVPFPLHALRLDGRGRGIPVGPEAWFEATPESVCWIHCDMVEERSRHWVEERTGLDALVTGSLLADETRPRAVVRPEGLLLLLRGVNLNPGADPEDMVVLRAWIEPSRILTVRRRSLRAVQDVVDALAAGEGPRTPASLVVRLADRLTVRISDCVGEIDDAVDALEEDVLEAQAAALRPRLAALRRRAIALRRYVAPQREALNRIAQEPLTWMEETHRVRIREVADRTTRCIEDLDAARDRAGITQEELNSRLGEEMNRRMYVLSLVAAIFLPLGLVTGLLGINVGGIPGSEDSRGFIVVCLLLVLFAALGVLVLRKARLM